MAEKNWLVSRTRPSDPDEQEAARKQEEHQARKEAEVARKDRARSRKREAAMRASVRRALYSKAIGARPPQTRALRDANRVADVLHTLFGASLEVVKFRLEQGHTQTAQNVVDRYLDILGDRIDEPLGFTPAMTTADKANLVLERVAAGQMGLDHGRKLLELIGGVAGLDLADEIEAMKEQLQQLGEGATVVEGSRADNPAAPSWGAAAKREREAARIEKGADDEGGDA